MALALRSAAPLKAQVRLAQAVSEFEASLNAEHKAAFRNARMATKASPPTPSDVMRLTAEIDSRVRQEHGPSRCFGPRLTNILQAVQQFAALGDTVVGGSQNLVACGVWSAVRMMLHMAIGYASYLEKLSLLFMTAGRQAPRYQALAIIYPRSKTLQRYLSEYFIVIVRVCQKIQKYAMKSAFGQFKSSLSDADLKEFQADLEVWGNAIKDEATLLLNQRIQSESQENNKARALVSMWSTSSARQQALERKMRWLDECSTYDFQTTWKQIRKRGSTSLLPTWADYQQWKQTSAPPAAILFSGKIGAGKSVTLANIVDDLHLSGDTMIIYFFCRHDILESLKSRIIIGSLARQYLSQFPEYSDAFKEDVPTLDLDEITALMKPQHDNRPRYLLIDGLDECSMEEQRSVLTQISWLQRQSNWRLGFSARISAQSVVEHLIKLKWHISLPISNPDIERYIDDELKARISNGQLKLGDPNIESEIREALLGGANGMFLWVALQLDQICSEVSDHSIRLAIKSLPRDLSEMYARILSISAAKDAGHYHIRLFKFLAAAFRPLTIYQVQEIASVTIGDTTWDPSKCINDVLKVVGFCGSLVMIEEEEQTVRFVHHSARSFCQGVLRGFGHWNFCFSDQEAHREIGETAVTYLSYGIFDTRLSTNVIPEVDVRGFTERIIDNTLGKSKAAARLALGFVKPKHDGKRDIGQFLVQAQRESTSGDSETTSLGHPFLPYAEKFWILHTKDIDNSMVRELWERLFDEVKIHDLQLTPHVLGPLDSFPIPCEHSLASAFLWAINYSHVAVFDRLMELGSNDRFSPKSSWARFRLFRSLLLHLQAPDSLAGTPRLGSRMIERLLPLTVILRVHGVVEWMIRCVDPEQTLRAFQVAVSFGNFKSAALISTSPAINHPSGLIIPTELLEIACYSQNPQMVHLVAKMGAARSADTNASALSKVLNSNMHQAPLLRILLILTNAGVRLSLLSKREVSVIFHLLAMSQEINLTMASETMTRILKANSDLPGLYSRTFYQACYIGSYELAYATWLSFIDAKVRSSDGRETSSFPFGGDELALASQTVSKSRVKLANWLVTNGYHEKDKRTFRRAIMLRNWQLADALLNEDIAEDVLTFCTNHELLHVCVYGGDLIGIDFLLKIGMDFNTPSTGPMFKHETPMQTLMEQDSDSSMHFSIAALCTRGVITPARISPGFTAFKGAVETLILTENPSTWDPEVRKIVRGQLERGIFSDNYSWFVCGFAASIGEVVRANLLPVDGDIKTGLEHLENWLELWIEMLHSDFSLPACDRQEGILVLREVFRIASELDEAIGAQTSTHESERWEAQMRLWQFVDLFVNQTSRDHVGKLSRDEALKELSLLMCKRPLDGVFPEPITNCSGTATQVYEALRLADKGLNLPWILQYLFMHSQNASISVFCGLSADWEHMVRGTNISKETQHALKLLGWTDTDLKAWTLVDGPIRMPAGDRIHLSVFLTPKRPDAKKSLLGVPLSTLM